MDPQNLVSIFSTTDPTLAELLKQRLEVEGIDSQISGENQGGFAGVLNVRVLVRAADADRAVQFIRQQESRPEDEL